MICSIHQPNYMPYLGLFNKIKQSNVFVFYDIAQYTKGDYHNRNSIKGPNGPFLLSLPVSVKLSQNIIDVKFDNKILQKHLKCIKESYKKASYYNDTILLLDEIYSYQGDSLSEFNINYITKCSKYIGLETKFVTLSELVNTLDSKSTDALIDICKLVGATEYISGAGGKNYIDEQKFINSGIKLHYQEYKHPIYKQLRGDFIPYLSIIDLLFNEGINSREFI